MNILFYINLLILAFSFYMGALRSNKPKRFVLLNVILALAYSATFILSRSESGQNMGYLIDHYWILAILLHWFAVLIFVIAKTQRSD